MYAHSDAPALHWAVPHGSVNAVKLLLGRKGLYLVVIDSNGATALHLAVRSRRLEVVDLILRHPRVDVNCIDNDGKSPLWWSTFLSYYDITERLLAEENIDANLIGGFGRLDTPSAPLHHATTQLDTTILKQLLAAPGIDLNICAARQTPFSAAAAAGRVSGMRILMSQRGVEINTGRILMDPPLCQAVAGGHLEAVRLLVQQGQRLRINQGTLTMHDTALGIAARAGDLEIVRTLLRHERIDPNLENRWLESPLVLAVKGAHVLVVDALLADQRADTYGLREAQAIATHEEIRGAIQYEIDGRRARCGWIKAHWSLA
jgi:ankyrin repeat protein